MMSPSERSFVNSRRIGYLATADLRAIPHVVPVCFSLSDDSVYITIDEKPKRSSRSLKRLRNIAENPKVALVFDRYDEDWKLLGWVMLHGSAVILLCGGEYDNAQSMLRLRYPQLSSMQISGRPVIAVRIERSASWGYLSEVVPPEIPLTRKDSKPLR